MRTENKVSLLTSERKEEKLEVPVNVQPPVNPETDFKELIQPNSIYYKKIKADRKFRQRSFLLLHQYIDRMNGAV